MTNHRVVCFYGKQVSQTADESKKIVRSKSKDQEKKQKDAEKKTIERLKEKKSEVKAKDKAIVDQMLKTVKTDTKKV